MVKIKSRAARIAPVMRQDFLKTIKAEFSKFQNCKFAMSLQYLKKEVRDEKKLIFACR